MKNLLFIFSLSFLILFSCSSGDDSSNSNDINSILLKRFEGIPGVFTELVYEGNKLDRVFTSFSYTNFTYSGDFITLRQHYNDDDQLTSSVSYQYSNEKLSRLEVVDGFNNDNSYYINFTYPNDKIRAVWNGAENSYSLGHYDSNGNIYKWELFENNQLLSTTDYTYDNKNNPYKYITGWDATRYDRTENNNVLTVETVDSDGTTTYTESHSYEYNDLNFPTLNIHNGDPAVQTRYYY